MNGGTRLARPTRWAAEHGGGLAEYMLVPVDGVDAGCLFKASADLPSEQLALAEPLGCVVNGQRLTPVGPEDTVLVLGAGKNAIRLAPPLVFTKAQADSVIAVLDAGLTEVAGPA